VRVTTIGKMVTVEEGVRNPLWGATAPKNEIVNGEYYEPVGVPGNHVKLSKDKDLARRLWEWTEEELKDYQLI
jgi:retinol dehydrogenase-12